MRRGHGNDLQNSEQDFEGHAFMDLFPFSDGGFEGEDVGAGFLVGEEAGLPAGVVDLRGDSNSTEGLAPFFGEALLDGVGSAFGDCDEGPGGLALPEPNGGGEMKFFGHGLSANLRNLRWVG